jgi:general secretion pathway protein A
MYLQHFGLEREPFSVAPDPRFLFRSEKHREALAHLLYGLRGSGGFVLLTGEIGAGKTTVWRAFVEQLPGDVDVAYIVNPKLGVQDLLARVCDELRVDPAESGTHRDPVDAIYGHLLLTQATGRRTLLVVDEAQLLAPEVLEQMRLLTNLETSERKLMQVLLIGQPELRDLLARPMMEPLAQRVVARYHLPALAAEETAQYVAHRLQVAGLKGALPFDGEALAHIHRLCRGVPRRINLLADRALLGAWAAGRGKVDHDTVQRAAGEVFGLEVQALAEARRAEAERAAASAASAWGGPAAAATAPVAGSPVPVPMPVPVPVPATAASPSIPAAAAAAFDLPAEAAAPAAAPAGAPPARAGEDLRRWAIAAGALVAGAAIATWGPRWWAGAGAAEVRATAAAAVPGPAPGPASGVRSGAASPAAAPAPVAAAGPATPPAAPAVPAAASAAALPGWASEDDAWRALAARWNAALPAGEPCATAVALGLRCHRARGGIAPLAQLDRPALIPLLAGESRVLPGGFVLLLGAGGGEALIATPAGETRVSIAELAAAWRGDFATLWRTPPGWREGPAAAGEPLLLRWVEERLPAAAGAGGAVDLAARIAAFQLAEGLAPDGVAGPLTLMRLNRVAGVAEPGWQRGGR